MRDYGKVSPGFWIGATGKQLRGDTDTQLVAMYLMTSPHANMIGVFHCPLMYIAHETGLSQEGALKGLQRLIRDGFCTFDADRDVVWVHEMARFQIGAELNPKDKQVHAVRKAYLQIPEGQIRRGFHARYRAAFHLPDEAEAPSPLDGPSKGDRSPLEAPPKPGAGAGAGAGAGSSPTPDGVGCPRPSADDQPNGQQDAETDSCPHQAIVDAYHEMLPMGRRVRIWNEARRTKLRARWREDRKRQSVEWWRKLFGYIAKSDFLTGRVHSNDRQPFEVDLEWIITPANLVKIIEGKYHREAA